MRLRNIPRAAQVVAESPLVIHDPAAWKGNWAGLFGNAHPLHVEVGMGKGQFLRQMSAKNPQINFVGMERYTSVLLRALERVQAQDGEAQVLNLRFLCMDARGLPDVFGEGEVAHIYLNFSDPWPKERHKERRLVSRQFLERYRHILVSGGKVEFKTDNRALFDFAIAEAEASAWEILLRTYDLHADPEQMEGNVPTEYEEKFSQNGNKICKAVLKAPGCCAS